MDQPKKGGILKGSKGAMNNGTSMNGDAGSSSSMHSISTQASVYAPTFNPAIKPTSDWYDTINDSSDTSLSERNGGPRLIQGITKPMANIAEGTLSNLPNQASSLAATPANSASNLTPNDSSLASSSDSLLAPNVPPNDPNLPPTFSNLNPHLGSNSSTNFSGTLTRSRSLRAKSPHEEIHGYFSDASSTNSTIRTHLKPRLYSHLLTHGRASSISQETTTPSPAVIVNLPFKDRNFNFDFENTSLTSSMGVQTHQDVYGHPSSAPIGNVHMSHHAYQSHARQYGGRLPHIAEQSQSQATSPTQGSQIIEYQSHAHQHGSHTAHTGKQLMTPSQAPTSALESNNMDYRINLRRTSSMSGDPREMGAFLDDNNSLSMSSKVRSIRNSSISSSNLSIIGPLEAAQSKKANISKVSSQNSFDQSGDLSIEDIPNEGGDLSIEDIPNEGGEGQGHPFEKALKMTKDTFLLCIPKGICMMSEGNVKTICPSSIEDYDSMNIKDYVKSLWADAYQPTSFDAFLCHVQQAQLLRQLISQGNCPHIFFHGLSTYGKKSLIMTLLHQIFGPTAWKVCREEKKFKKKGEKKVSIRIVASKYHVELDAEDLEENARAILVGLFKEITQSLESSKVIDTHLDYETNFRVIVLYKIDKLSNDTQQLIRWLMDRYGDTCKLLLCADHASKVLDSVRTRCQTLAVDPPSQQEMVTVLQHIARREEMRVSLQFITRIANESNQNLRHAIESLQACKSSHHGQVDEDLPIPTGWEDDVAELAKDILMEQTPKRMFAARTKLQSLLKRHVPSQLLLQSLTIELLKKLSFHLKKEICYWHGLYEKRLSSTSSSLDKLEEFVAKIMSIYKKYKKATLLEAK